MAQQRILCLHGWRTNPEFMKLQMKSLKEKLSDIEFVFLEGPVSGMLAADDDVEEACMPPYFQWWEPLDGLKGQMDAVRYVLDYMRQDGPFDAILGFSEGAACASLVVASLQGIGRGPKEVAETLQRDFADVNPPRLLVSVCGICPDEELPPCGCFGRRRRPAELRPIHGISSVHVIGEQDEDRQNSERLVEEWFGCAVDSKASNVTVLYHPHGHRFPLDARSLAACLHPREKTRNAALGGC